MITTIALRERTAGGAIRLVIFGRAVPAMFFAWLAYLQLLRLLGDVHDLPSPVTPIAVVSGPLPTSLYLLFCLIPVFIYLGRPAPRARDGRLAPRALALLGTVMVLIIGALPQGIALYTPPSWIRGLSIGLSILAFAVIISALMFLRRSLSVFPEARRLVMGGPYRVVRHPLYAAEIVATVAFAIVNPTVLAVAILVPFIATQLLRSLYEERLLMRAFRQYPAYESHTRRLIPFTW
jgi:protein-S-isoprenylcysteine O-methyltransferase Ste14